MFDALGTPSLGWNLLQAIRKVTYTPVRYNVVSHYHADHIYGLQAFDAAYAQTDWSKYKDMPAFEANNRGNAYRIFLEMERSEFKTQNQ